MVHRTFSERLFEEFCEFNGVPCAPVPTGSHRTPDYEIVLADCIVVCEVKQINPNREDLEELTVVQGSDASGRFVPSRLRERLKHVSAQLKATSQAGRPTLLIVYDNTPFKMYTMHFDVVQAMFGHHSVAVSISATEAGNRSRVSKPFFGGNRGFGPTRNTAVSAVGILDGGPTARPLTLRLYHNPYARVHLEPSLFLSLPVSHEVLPDAKAVRP